MKFAAIAFTLMISISAMAGVECYVNNKAGEHVEFNAKSQVLDSAEPFGIVRLEKVKNTYYLSSTINGETTIATFKKSLSLTKQGAAGVGGGLGNIVCN